MLANIEKILRFGPAARLRVPAILLFVLLLLHDIQTKKINKCCPLGQLLSSSGSSCIPMISGTALPKVRVIGE